ncbi:MAG TPA: tetratricopeptide repeat protein, partial [Novosphingobium sp.]|nr:tetratricopeptide repeat protein [Novosphingobium sp.]
LQQQACDAKEPLGCYNLGVHAENGLGIPRNYGRAANLYRQACDMDDSWACFNLAVLYYKGRGVKADRDQAIALFRKALVLDPTMDDARKALVALGAKPQG